MIDLLDSLIEWEEIAWEAGAQSRRRRSEKRAEERGEEEHKGLGRSLHAGTPFLGLPPKINEV